MDRVLRPHAAYAAAYLADIVIYDDDWGQHMQRVAAVLQSLRRAGVTANPKKCVIRRREIQYLGFHLGGGKVRGGRRLPSAQDQEGGEAVPGAGGVLSAVCAKLLRPGQPLDRPHPEACPRYSPVVGAMPGVV